MKPVVTAIILNYRAPQHTIRCVHALLQQTMTNEMEILVIDNHSDTDAIGILRNQLSDLPRVRILESSKNLGFGGGYEIGIRQAKGRYILINNPEKRLHPQSLEKMMRAMESDPTIGILAPKLIHEDGTVRPSARAFPRLIDVITKRTFLQYFFPKLVERYLQLHIDTTQTRSVDWAVGGCLLLRRTLIEKMGAFDTRYFLFFEDIDLCRRCWKEGMSVVYFPEATAIDRTHRLSDMSAFRMPFTKIGRAHIKSALQYFWKWR